jgi:hypothetical protein
VQGEEETGRETGGKRERAERRPGVIDYEGGGPPLLTSGVIDYEGGSTVF